MSNVYNDTSRQVRVKTCPQNIFSIPYLFDVVNWTKRDTFLYDV